MAAIFYNKANLSMDSINIRKILISSILFISGCTFCEEIRSPQGIFGEYQCKHDCGLERLNIDKNGLFTHTVIYHSDTISITKGNWKLNVEDSSNIYFSTWDERFEPGPQHTLFKILNCTENKYRQLSKKTVKVSYLINQVKVNGFCKISIDCV